MGKVDTLYFMTSSITKETYIKKSVISFNLCLMPYATYLVIYINNLSDLLHSTAEAPMPGVLTVGCLYPCHWIRYTSHIHQNIIHIENQFVSSILSYSHCFTCKALSLVAHQYLYQSHLSTCSAFPSVTAANMHVILSGCNFNMLVNSP